MKFGEGQETKARILGALHALAWDAKPQPGSVLLPAQPEDAVFIYYAGHGTSDGKHFYMLPAISAIEARRSAPRGRVLPKPRHRRSPTRSCGRLLRKSTPPQWR